MEAMQQGGLYDIDYTFSGQGCEIHGLDELFEEMGVVRLMPPHTTHTHTHTTRRRRRGRGGESDGRRQGGGGGGWPFAGRVRDKG